MLVTEETPVSLSWISDTGSDVDATGVSRLSALCEFVENLKTDTDDVCGAMVNNYVLLEKFVLRSQQESLRYVLDRKVAM